MNKQDVIRIARQSFPNREHAVTLLEENFEMVDATTLSVSELTNVVANITSSIQTKAQEHESTVGKFFVVHALIDYVSSILENMTGMDPLVDSLDSVSVAVFNTAIADMYLQKAEQNLGGDSNVESTPRDKH